MVPKVLLERLQHEVERLRAERVASSADLVNREALRDQFVEAGSGACRDRHDRETDCPQGLDERQVVCRRQAAAQGAEGLVVAAPRQAACLEGRQQQRAARARLDALCLRQPRAQPLDARRRLLPDGLLKQADVGAARLAVVRYANLCCEQQGDHPYSQEGTRLQIPEKKGDLWSTDCSGWVTGLYYWATNGNQKYNPNGASVGWRSYGNTVTQFNSSNGTTISREALRAGDLIIYGPNGANHVNVYLGNNIMAGFGSNNGPKKYALDYHYPGWGQPTTYRSWLP